MIRAFYTFFLLVFSASAFAVAPSSVTKWYREIQPSITYSSQSGACAAIVTQEQVGAGSWVVDGGIGKYPSVPNFTPDSCTTRWTYSDMTQGPFNRGRILSTTVIECPDGTAPNTSLPSAQQCADPPPTCTAGQTSTQTYKDGTGPAGAEIPSSGGGLPTSDGQCAVKPTKMVRCFSVPNASGGQDFYCTYEVTQTGAPAASDANAPSVPSAGEQKPTTSSAKPAPEGQCPAGTVTVGIDSSGTIMCAGSGTSPSTPTRTETKLPTTTTTNPDGTTTVTDTDKYKNTDGSETTVTRTCVNRPDGLQTCTYQESTGTGTGGGAGKNDSTKDKRDDFCAKHPELNVCKNSTVSGECENVACTGDAIQCAILRQQKKAYCEAAKGTPARTLGEQMMGGNDPLQYPKPANAQVIALGQLDQSGFLGGGSCLNDIQVGSVGVSLPVSQICEHLLPLRFAIMTIAGLICFGMLRNSVLKG